MLTPNRTTVYIWKEDVVRPRTMLTKLARGRVQATDSDVRAAFDAYHGEKVECRMILWPDDPRSKSSAMQNYAKLRDDDKEFDQAATAQMSPSLAKDHGRVSIGRQNTGNKTLEDKAFGLQPREGNQVIETPAGVVLL